MTQVSMPWDGTTTGDAVEAPYDAATEWANLWKSLTGSGGLSGTRSGVFMHELNSLAPTPFGTSSPVNVDTGRALVYGTWYENDSVEPVAIPTPASATRNDYIVLRKTWATKQVRLTRVAGAEGGGLPTITQSPGIVWDMILCSVSVTTAGVVTVVDMRSFIGVEPSVPYCSITRGSNQSIPDTTYTRVEFNTVIFESAEDSNMWDAAAPQRITIPFTGIWRIEGIVHWGQSFGVAGARRSRLTKNATITPIADMEAVPDGINAMDMAPIVYEGVLVAGEYVEFYVSQTTTDILQSLFTVIGVDVGGAPKLSARWIRNRYT